LHVHTPTIAWHPALAPTGNLRGTRRTLDGCNAAASLELGLLSRDGWVLVDDSAAPRFAAPPSAAEGWITAPRRDGYVDWYLFLYGRDYHGTLADYRQLAGPTPLIPRFVLGAWWSRYWAYSEADLRQLVADFRAHRLPLDVLVLDMDWHTPDHWTGYTWNKTLFPDPPAFLRWLHQQGLRTTLNLHPAGGVQAFEAIYADFAARVGQPADGTPVQFRATNPAYMQAYFEMLHHPLEDAGVDFWWMDWQQGNTAELGGQFDPLLWINHLHARDLTRRQTHGAPLRPMLYSRWGGLGNHRYPIGFSGDTPATWEALQFQPYMTATASNVLYGWWSHDIGGHIGATDPHLYARWVQFGALSPCLRLHSTNQPEAERRPYAFAPQVLEAARAAFALRYQLVPYWYTLAAHEHHSGAAPIRPMYHSYAHDDNAYLARDQYLIGDSLLAAPITQPSDPTSGLAEVDVWLPAGVWYDWQRGGRYDSAGAWQRLRGELDYIPLLARAGAIVPLAVVAPTTDAQPKDHLIVRVFPHAADGTATFTLYEDDGVSEAYQHGHAEHTTMMHQRNGNIHTLSIDPTSGVCPSLPRERSIEVWFEGLGVPSAVRVDDSAHAAYSYDLAAERLTVYLEMHAKTTPQTLQITAVPTATAASGQQTFMRVFEYTVKEDAVAQLAQVLACVSAADLASGPLLRGEWRLHTNDDIQRAPFEVALNARTAWVACPLALPAVRSHLELSATLTTASDVQTLTYASHALLPAATAWGFALDAQGPIMAQREQRTHETHRYVDGFEVNLLTLDSPFDVAASCHAFTTFELSDTQRVRLVAFGRGIHAQAWLDDQPHALSEHTFADDSEIKRIVLQMRRVFASAPLDLSAGRHALRIHTQPRPNVWGWTFGGALVTDDGTIVAGVRWGDASLPMAHRS
jgi:hypothetical protein